MNKVVISVFIAVAIAAWQCNGLDCSGVVTKESEGVLNWLGNINFTVPVDTDETVGWSISLFFDQIFTGVGVWDGWVSYNGTAKWAEIVNRGHEDAKLEKGDRKSLRFRINYGRDIPQPKVISLRFQDIEMCR